MPAAANSSPISPPESGPDALETVPVAISATNTDQITMVETHSAFHRNLAEAVSEAVKAGEGEVSVPHTIDGATPALLYDTAASMRSGDIAAYYHTVTAHKWTLGACCL
jgi:hypothetical protein